MSPTEHRVLGRDLGGCGGCVMLLGVSTVVVVLAVYGLVSLVRALL